MPAYQPRPDLILKFLCHKTGCSEYGCSIHKPEQKGTRHSKQRRNYEDDKLLKEKVPTTLFQTFQNLLPPFSQAETHC